MFHHEERLVPDRCYADYYSTFAEYLGRYEFAARFLSSRAIVLDLGCGCGYGAAHLTAAPARRVVGIDRSQDGTHYARKHYASTRLSFVTAGATSIPMKPGSLDAVIAMELIEHVQDDKAVLSEVKRVLKPGGVFVASTPNRLVTGSGEKPANPFHVREYTPQEFRAFLRQAFNEVSIYGQAVTPAFRVYQDNMARIWHNLSLIPVLYEQLHALRSRLELYERFTGLALLRRLKRRLLLGKQGTPGRSGEQLLDLNQEFRHAQALVNSMADWAITPYKVDLASVLVAVCRA
jgi:ubiquinone/menaquinone biosynthesis C-methylase UbiE